MKKVYRGRIRLKSGEEVEVEAGAIQYLENGDVFLREAYFQSEGELIGPFSINAVTGEMGENDTSRSSASSARKEK